MKIVIELLGPYSAWTRDRAGLIGLVHDLTRSALNRSPYSTNYRHMLDQSEAANPHQSGSEISASGPAHGAPSAPRNSDVLYDYGPMVPDPDAIYRMYVDSISLSLESRNRGPRTHKAHRRAQRLQ